MRKAELLICITHHHSTDRLEYLLQILQSFKDEYSLRHDIIVDTNAALDVTGDNTTTVHHNSLAHPFHLAWMHRQHMKERIEDYDWFMYVEDDIYLPFENFLNYLRNFELLWPDYVPSFVRVERFNGEEYALDVTTRRECNLVQDGFCTLKQPYHGFWIMPQQALKETMRSDFVRLSESREVAASYPMWELHKTPVVQIEGNHVSRLCYAHHLPNNYARCPADPHAKIKVADIFL